MDEQEKKHQVSVKLDYDLFKRVKQVAVDCGGSVDRILQSVVSDGLAGYRAYNDKVVATDIEDIEPCGGKVEIEQESESE